MASTVQEKEEMNDVKVEGDGELNGNDKKMETNEVVIPSFSCTGGGDGDATNKEIVPETENKKDDGSDKMMKVTSSSSGDDETMKDQWMMKKNDPLLLYERSEIICENDYVILAFADGRQIFAQAVQRWRGKSPPVKINKRTYPTKNLIGLPYGTVLELRGNQLVPLPPEEDVIPSLQNLIPTNTTTTDSTAVATVSDKGKSFSDEGITSQKNDNRNLLDNNTSQAIDQRQVESMREEGMDGQDIVATLIENSKTFDGKTDFSKAKYITKKQLKYQPRCRILRCTASTITEALFLKDHRRIMNLRVDTMAQILSYSNVCAGSRVFVFECPTMGLLTGALAQRMGGYGQILSIYSGQQPSFSDMLAKFNLSFPEQYSIKYIHSSQLFTDLLQESQKDDDDEDEKDVELKEREQLKWPCPLQPHTRQYLETTMKTDEERTAFLAKRCARFARKLTRHTFMEANQWLLRTNDDRKCDSIIIATRYDPTYTLFKLLPYLETSCPFVVLCEFLEPLAECFRELQKQSLAINMRLTDTWLREYQILPGRTHPNMNMSQNGGFLLTGIKLCPSTGKNEMDEELVKEIRAQIGGRRGKKNKNKRGNNGESTNTNNNINNSNGRSKKRNASKMKNCNDKNNNIHDSKRAK